MSPDAIDAMAAPFATDVLGFGAHLDDVEIFCSVIGVSHGEPLRAPNAHGLADPVAHCRHNGFSAAHAFEGVH